MKRRVVSYGVVVLALAAVAGLLGTSGHQEPSYQGRPLTEWIHEATEGPEEQRQRAIDAMLAMEPELFPWLVKMTGRRDSHFSIWWSRSPIRRRWLGGRFEPRLAREDQVQALLAFQALGPSATPAVPLLETLFNKPDTCSDAADALAAIRQDTAPVFTKALTNQSLLVRATATESLGLLGVEGRVALPLLVECLLKSTNSRIRASAGWSMGQIARGYSATEQSKRLTNELAALIACLDDSEAGVRAASAAALGFFGRNARPAASTLRRLFKEDPDPQVREMAELTLKSSGEWKWDQVRDQPGAP